ncbi:late secretory pathway protein AVL9 homolog [Musca vetustissima]|uniref:late secretory pathway protein AVL9 homolog n=1 Tax=Musca vetustissima TaxID=27455 RepID=UPI002AB7E12B|nr:late secretory pathway protein AVL9 homolog [Musca vetustissima]
MNATATAQEETKPPILHILVVGFHHKLGCQVEFSYPPLVAGSTGKNECPSGWKYLSTLALPDGSHNFIEDTVFFNLPSLTDPTESVYGVSCYRQIPVEKLKIRTADVTRSTVQKSVCCLARLPIYGYIEVKLSLIADAFFEEGDFSSTDILVKAYEQLNACLLDGDESRRALRHFHVGLSLREIVLNWRHKTLQLLKLFLLQRKVVCFGSPVRGMCALILGIASLIPRLLEKGFQEVACVRTSRPLSPMPDYTDSLIKSEDCKTKGGRNSSSDDVNVENTATTKAGEEEGEDTADNASHVDAEEKMRKFSNASSKSSEKSSHKSSSSPTSGISAGGDADTVGSTSQNDKNLERSSSFTKDNSLDASTTMSILTTINPDEYRAPISIFASGNLCLPYLSLPYMDLLTDPSVLSYVIGTSNVLFQQRHHLADILIDIENGNLEARDPELRKQLILSTEDLRFMDYILRHVQVPKEDAEGGSDQWIRQQFQGYLLALLRTSVVATTSETIVKDVDHFNANFMTAFQKTQCYQEWFDVRPDNGFFEALPMGHPFSGATLSVTDVKLKLAQTMQSTESGRKINQAVNNTSRAVGGALSQAKGAISGWWSSMTTTAATTGSSNTENRLTDQSKQDISVTFQNSGDTIEEGISIHTEEKIVFSTKNGEVEGIDDNNKESADGDNGEGKLVEKAEELKEGKQIEANKVMQSSGGSGIVEIGKEAELLDRNDQNLVGDRSSSNGNSVFIV